MSRLTQLTMACAMMSCAAGCDGLTKQLGDAAVSASDARVLTKDDGGSPEYSPCSSQPCRYMPLGDSITEGYEGGYRVPLFRRAVAANKWLTFVGSQANGPEMVDGLAFSRQHEGHSGYSIDASHSQNNLSDLVDASLQSHRPQIIALMIGANDVARAHFTDSPERLAALLDQIARDAPDATIALAKITPTQDDATNTLVVAYNAAMNELVRVRIEQGRHITLVDMYSAFIANPNYKTEWLLDMFHPNSAGDEVLAQVWFDAINRWLPPR